MYSPKSYRFVPGKVEVVRVISLFFVFLLCSANTMPPVHLEEPTEPLNLKPFLLEDFLLEALELRINDNKKTIAGFGTLLSNIAHKALPVSADRSVRKATFEFGATPSYVTQLGTTATPSTTDGEFDSPNGVGIDASGNIYVADKNNQRIQKFNSSGTFLTKWGSSGTGDGQFGVNNAADLAIDSSGNVWVVDRGNHRIQKFSNTGTFLTKFGSNGTADGQFSSPSGIAINSGDTIYIADRNNERIQAFDINGNFLFKWGGTVGTGNGEFASNGGAHDLAIDSSGNVFVTDRGNDRIQKFSATGTFLATFGTTGTGDGQMMDPVGVAVHPSGDIYVADRNNERVQIWNSSLVFQDSFGSSGTANGSFASNGGALDMAFDSQGEVWVVDRNNDRVQKFDVDFTVDNTAPTVTSVSSTTANGTYKAGDAVVVTVTFSEAVTVTGTPQLTLETGTTDRTINYNGTGSGTTTLQFGYTVQAGDVSADLDYVATNSLTAGTSIKDAADNDATLTLPSPGAANSLGANKALVIDSTVPTVTSVSSSTANGTYKAGDVVVVTVTFSEAVTVTGTPQLTLETGATDRTINYNGTGSGTTTLQFGYTVQAGDESADLDYVATNSLTAGTSIQDAAGNDATLTLASPGAANSLGANKALVIDGVAPTVTSVSSSTANGTYKVGDAVVVTVTFSEAVTVTGTPQLTLETGTTDRTINYNGTGSGTTTLQFGYTVQAGDVSADLDYVATNSLTAGTSIKDAAGNDATLTLASPGAANSLGANKALVIDGTVPTVTSVSSTTANGTYKVGDAVVVTVTFSEAVTVTGTPQLTLETGATDRTINYNGTGSGTTVLQFGYTVQAGDVSADLDYVATNSLTAGTSIKDAAGNDATLTLASPGAANSLGNNKALVIDGTAPTVTSVSSTTANGTYKVGDAVVVTVTFSEAVTVTGTPQLTLETGATDRTINYNGTGSGTTVLQFGYTVQAGDVSADLDYVATNSLTAGTSIKSGSGNDAALTLPSPGAANSLGANKTLIIDTTVPTVTSVSSSTANGTYKVGDAVVVTVTFSEAVTVTGTPQLILETGTTDRTIDYNGTGSGTTVLQFGYTVQAGDVSADLDYVATNSLTAGTSIKDAAGNDATLTLASPGAANSLGNNKALVIDGTAPTVTSVSSTTANGTYKVGDAVVVTVTFSEAVTVTGTPQLTLETGTTDRTIDYNGTGSGTTVLQFGYTVQAGDVSADLDYVATNSLTAGTSIKDAAGNDATLTLASSGTANSLGNNKALVIDGVVPTVTSVSSTTANGTYKVGDAVVVTVTFSEAVTVTGTPQLTLETGTTDRTIDYNGTGSGTTVLQFGYTVQAGDVSADLDYVATNSLTAGTSIKDAAGNDATLTLASPGAANSLGANKALVIDGVAPTVTSVSSTTANGTYKVGDQVLVTVTFSEVVIVSGTPTIELDFGGANNRIVNYNGTGSGTTTLQFTYTVQAGDNSADLDYAGTGAMTGVTGVADVAGNLSSLILPSPGAAGSLGANKAIVIDGVSPTVTVVSSSTANGTYKVGDAVVVTVTFSEAVTVTGTPQLTLETGTTDRTIDYNGTGSGTTVLQFGYTVQAGDVSADLDYVATNSLTAGTSIKDAAGNDATLTLASPGAVNSLGANKALVIDGVVPTVTNVGSSVASRTYRLGEIIDVQIAFSENVNVTGIPQLTLETGVVDQVLNYVSGDGSNTLLFSYTVQSGDESTDLDYKSTNSLTLNGGTINDQAGNAAVLTLPTPGAVGSLGDNKNFVIDGVVPTVTGVNSIKADGTYGIGEAITVTVTFSEAVTVTGTPQLELETGVVDRTIDYASGSGTNTLSFTYTTQSGDESTDLDYKATNSLSLNGGTIKDGSGNDATLTLVSPGAAGSLGTNKAIVISAFPTVSLSVGNASIAEASGTSTVTATLSQTSSQDVTVTLGYSGTATNGTDYNSTASTSITITAGQLSASTAVGITATQDTDAEGNETIIIDITGVTKGTENGVQQQTITINDDDAAVVTSVSSTTADGSYKIGDVVAVTVTFNLPVIVTGTPQLTLETGTTDRTVNYISGTTTSTLTFNYTVQAGDESSDLDYVATTSLTLNGGTIKNNGLDAILTLASPGAAGSLGANKAIVVDGIAPTVTVTLADAALTAGETSLVTITFSEVVTGFDNTDLTIPNGTMTAVSSSDGGTTYTATYTPTAGLEDATNVITVDETGITDVAGNAGTGTTSSANFTINTKIPTAVITMADGALKVGETSLVTVTFSEVVTGFDNTDLTIPNGTMTAVSSADGGTTYTATYTPTASVEDATNVITLDNIGVVNGGGNAGTGTTDSPNFTIDTKVPTAVITMADAALTVGETSLVTITFSEVVTGFDNTDLTIPNGTMTAVSSSDGGTTYTATYTPTAGVEDATNVITVDETGITDVAGNTGTGTTSSANFTINTKVPTAVITMADAALTVGETSLVTITFSEVVTGFDNTDLTIPNGTMTAVSSSDGGTTYTATYTPTASVEDATNVITLDNTGVVNGGGNAGTGTTDSPNFTIDTKAPTVTVVLADAALTAGETSLVTITFSEVVTGFDNTDLTIPNGTMTAVSSADGGKTYTSTFTPTAGIEDAANVITVDETGITDVAGNAGVGTTSSANFTINTKVPTAVITMADGALKVGETSLVTITFSEVVTGFDNTDLTIPNGTMTAVSSADGGTTYTATYTPTAGVEDATNVITLDNTGVVNGGSNAGTGTTDSPNFTVDTKVPTVTVVLADAALTVGETSLVTITFSEVVTGFDNTDLTIPNGSMTAVSSADGGTTYTATYTPTADVEDATNIITVDETGITDVAGNAGVGTTSSANFTIDTKAPAIPVVSSISTDSGLSSTDNITNDNTIIFTGTAEANTTVEVFIDGSSIGTTTANGSGAWTYDHTGTVLADNTYSVTAKASDASGNVSPSSATLSVKVDTSIAATPTVESISTDSGSSGTDEITNDNTLFFNGTAEPNSLVKLFIDGSSIGTITADGSGNYSFDHTGTTLSDGTISVTARARDEAGNDSAIGAALSVTVDTNISTPVVSSITTDAGSSSTDGVTNDNTLVFTGTAEANSRVKLFIDGTSIGTVTADGSGNYSFDYTGTTLSDGTISVTARARDVAGNDSAIGAALNIKVDTSQPIATLSSSSSGTVSGVFSLNIEYNEEVSGFTLSDLTVSGGSAGNFTSVTANKKWSVDITPSASGTVTVSLAAGQADDAAGNSNSAATPFSILFNNSPTDISSSSTSILENNAVGDVVGNLSSTDANGSDTHAYSLVSGTGDTDNGSFTITGNQLKAGIAFDRETKSSYSIRIRTTDSHGGTFDKQFTITIDNVAEADMRITGDLNIPATALGLTSNFNVTIHNDGDADLTISSITYPTAYGGPAVPITITPGNNQVVTLTFSPTAAIVYSGNIVITSNGGTGTLAVSADGAIVTAVEQEVLRAEDITTYPNPATDKLTIDLSSFTGKTLDISIRDLQGIEHFIKKNHRQASLEVDVSRYTSGVYLMLFRSKGQVVQKKVMIRR